MPVVKDWSEHAAVKATVQEDWKVLLDAPAEFWHNKEVGQAALESAKQQESMENMLAELAKNRNFVMGTGALELASEELKNDPMVVKYARRVVTLKDGKIISDETKAVDEASA